MDKETKNVHAGHRKRLRDLVSKVGLENLNEIQALEFALTYVLPRKNTNEIAHELLKVFGSFSAVFNAPLQELEKIKYLGKDSAKMLSQFKNIFIYYNHNRAKQIKNVKNLLTMSAYFYNMLIEEPLEHLYAMSLDDKGNIKAIKLLSVGTEKLLTIDKSELANFLFATKGKVLLLAHNHPNATCMPSKSDDESTQMIKEWMNSISLKLLDHLIVGYDGVFSFSNVEVVPVEKIETVEF